jgi:lipopolysaccharide export system protein LptC
MGLDAPALEDETAFVTATREGGRGLHAVIRTAPVRCARLLFLGIVGAWGCRPTHQRLADPPPEVVLHGVHARHFDGAELSAVGRAERLTYQRDSTRFVAFDAFMHFPARPSTSNRGPAASAGTDVHAPQVQGILSGKQADGLGGVTLTSDQGLAGKTERAHFDGVAMTAAGRLPVTLTGTGYTLEARAFVFHLRDATFEFEGAASTFGSAK